MSMRLVKLIVIFALISFLAAAAQSPLPHAPKNRAASTADPATPAQRGVAQPSVAQPSKEPAATASDPATPAGKDASEPGASGETADGKDVAAPSRKDVAPQANKEASLPLSVITEVVFAQEARIVDSMQHYTPLVE